jgi:hypothetical protein
MVGNKPPIWCSRQRIKFVLVLLMIAGLSRAAHTEPPLVTESRITLPHVSGRIDHMAVDLGRKRLLVAELGNNSLDVIDLAYGRARQRVTGLAGPQGVGYAATADLVGVANAGDGSVRFYRGEDLAPAGVLTLGSDADNIHLDAATGHFVVGYGSGGLAVIDPQMRRQIGDIRLAAHPEGFVIDPHAARAYVNVPNAERIAVVDLTAGRQIANWRVPELRANFPMALDAARAMLATVSRHPPKLVLIDARTGAVTDRLDTCGDADDVFFDARRGRIYISCGSGAIDVFDAATTGFRLSSRIETASGARASLFVPELDRLYVAEPAGWFGHHSAVIVLRPQP